MTSPEQIHIYGLRRSGTCYTTFLLQSNYDVEVLESKPNKHWFRESEIRQRKPEMPSVMAIKHPLSWAVSVYKHEQWLRKHDSKLPDLPEFEEYVVKEIEEVWNAGNKHMLSSTVGGHPFCVLRCEDLIEDSEETIAPIAGLIGLERKSEEWISSDRAMRPAPGGRETERPFQRVRYDNKIFMRRYSKKLLNEVWSTVDKLLANVFKYRKNGDW